MKYLINTFLICCLTFHLVGQDLSEAFEKQLYPAIQELREFVALPSDAHFPEDILANLHWLHKAFESRGFTTRTLETKSSPLFFAEMQIDDQLPTVLFYMHFDGQPVDPMKWNQTDPYTIVLKELSKGGEWDSIAWNSLEGDIDHEWRLFGRATADDKGPIVAFLNAMDIIHENSASIKHNIKVILDSEEEMGSRYLADAVRENTEVLAADALIINDGPMHISGGPTVIFGCRGVLRVDLTTYGPALPQHSGHFGNYAPNPVFSMARLLTSMKDQQGKVLIDGYYDGIELSPEVRSSLAAVPDDVSGIHSLLQIADNEKVGDNYQESLQYPSLNVRGMVSGWVGAQARTIVPDIAEVAIDIRLVPESDPDRLTSLIKAHIEKQGYHIVDSDPTIEERMKFNNIIKINAGKGTLPFRTDMDSDVGHWLDKALSDQFLSEVIKVRIMGGTVPISPFIRELRIAAVIVPLVNADNSQHSPNENLRIGNLNSAMQSFYAMLCTNM